MDAVNVDLKGFTDQYYLDMCGIDMEQVLITLKTVRQEKVMLEITNLIVPGHNDARQDLSNMTAWIKENLGGESQQRLVSLLDQAESFTSRTQVLRDIGSLREKVMAAQQ